MIMVSFFDSATEWAKEMWNKINIEEWLRGFGITSPEVIRGITFFAGAFIIGFFFKKYFKFALGCFIIVVILVVIFDSKGIINWDAFREFVGMDATQLDIGNIFSSAFSWVKNNLVAFISASLGFLLGYKLG